MDVPTQEGLKKFSTFTSEERGFGRLFHTSVDPVVQNRLRDLESTPISHTQLNQLLVLSHEAPMSKGFFDYYWMRIPEKHPYSVTTFAAVDATWMTSDVIRSYEHLYWGIYRIFLDSIYFFGNVRTGYRVLRKKSLEEIIEFYKNCCFDSQRLAARGKPLPLEMIAKDDRYLISEMACKSYEEGEPLGVKNLKEALLEAFQEHGRKGGGAISIKSLLEKNLAAQFAGRQDEFTFSADDLLNENVGTEAELSKKVEDITIKFKRARDAALINTKVYLSMVGDLDVYVATSMRKRDDFRKMSNICDEIFLSERLKHLNVRYFDPTLSAAAGHEDKGLIECLMVKCAKALVYCAGEKDSYGKDAEVAMALSLGKPVIIYCDEEKRRRFFLEIHPLSRLIRFDTGVAVGAVITSSTEIATELLYRIFENRMEYKIEKNKSGSLRIVETLTNSVVRIQTSDKLLVETFWNHYHETWN